MGEISKEAAWLCTAKALRSVLLYDETEHSAFQRYAGERETFAAPLRRMTALSALFVTKVSGSPFAPFVRVIEPYFSRQLGNISTIS